MIHKIYDIKRGISIVLCFIMLTAFISFDAFASIDNVQKPILDIDFEEYEVGDEALGGTVDKYNNSNMCKLTLDQAGKTLGFESLIVGEGVVSFDIACNGAIVGDVEFLGGGTPVDIIKFGDDGKITTYNGKFITRYCDKPKNIAIVLHASIPNFDVYVDQKMAVKGCFVPMTADKLVNFNIFLSSGADVSDVYIDNILTYPTYIKTEKAFLYNPDAAPSEASKKIILTNQNYIPSDNRQKEILKDCVSLHMRSGVAYSQKQKWKLSSMPFYKDEEFMVPAEFIEKAFSLKIVENKESTSIGSNIVISGTAMKTKHGITAITPLQKIDGILYLPLKSIVQSGLEKSIYHDTSAVHSGMIIISDGEFVAPTGTELQSLNDFCFYERPTKETFLSDYNASPLKGIHPRVMATKEDFERIREEVKSDSRKKKWFENLISYCDNTLSKVETVRYELRDGVRLLYVADEFSRYMTCLAFAYQLTGNKKYFDDAWRHIEVVATMPDWNPSHHIDVGTMATGYALAYDWFYDVMTVRQREIMEKGAYNNIFWIVNKAFESTGTPYGTVLHTNNHNVYCNSGIISACMAFTDVYPDITSQIGANVIRVLEYFMDKFAPLGAYYEGAAYATVAINFTTRLFASLYPIMGTLYSLDKAEGFNLSGDYLTNVQSDVSAFNFADGDQGLVSASGTFWLYDYYNIKGLKDGVADGSFYSPFAENLVYCLMWYQVEKEDENTGMQLDVHYPGDEIITMRNTYDPGQVFVGIKAGDTDYAHSHLDPGSFVFDAQGKRWAFDLGKDDYNLEYNYDKWDIFRRRPESHNTLLINPGAEPGYVVGSRANVLSYESKPKGVITTIDMTPLYGDMVNAAKRGFFFTDERRSLVVRDEVDFRNQSDAYWLMYIDSDVEINNDNTVILTDKETPDRKLKIEFLSSVPGEIKVEDAKPFPESPKIPEQNQNKGFYRLYYKISAGGNASITAKITPLDYVGSNIADYNVSIDSWKIPDGILKTVPELDSLYIDGAEYDAKNRYINYIVPDENSPVPTISAESSKYKLEITNASSLDEIAQILVTDPEDSSNSVRYSIKFTPKIRKRVFENYTALTMNNVEASAEPQAENPKEHVLDGNPDTRWSAEGKQWLMFDLESVQSFDTLLVSMYLGDERSSEITVDISQDGTNYTQLGSFTTSGTSSDYEAFELGSQKAQYVRVNFNGTSSGTWNSPTEIVVANKK